MDNFRNRNRGGRGFGGDRGGRGFGGDRGGRGFGGDRGGRGFGGRRDGGRPQMHKVICSKCGVECEVPFKPTSDKPVFCSKCFGNKSGDDSQGRNRFDDRKPKFGFEKKQSFRDNDRKEYQEQFDALNAKMDKILKMLTINVVESGKVIVNPVETRKIEKAKMKEINKDALKKSLAKAMGTEPVVEEVVVEKKVKKVAKKKAVAKKVATKKATTKKTTKKK